MTHVSARLKAAAVLSALAIAAGALVAGPALAAAPVGGILSGGMAGQNGPGSYITMGGLSVTVYPLIGSGEALASDVSEPDGSFSIAGLPQGDYRIRYGSADPASPYAPVWEGNNALEAPSTIITLGPADITNLGRNLAYGGTISGQISGVTTDVSARATAYLYNPTTKQFERFSYSDVADSAGNYSIVGLPQGKYLVRFDDEDNGLSGGDYLPAWAADPNTLISVFAETDTTGVNGTLTPDNTTIQRLAGVDRFDTSVEISKVGPDTNTAFIVNGLKFPDALSAGPAAASLGAPVLLVGQDFIPATVAEELDRIDVDVIYVIGGTGTISAAVEAQLGTYAPNVDRIEGVDRYATSRAIATEFFGDGARTAYFATGSNFPDALGAGPAAANELGPVILVDGASTALDTATIELVSDLDISKVVIAGGAGSFSTALEDALLDRSSTVEVYRRDGVNRYDTSVKIAKGSYPVANSVFLANGAGFADALAATGFAGSALERAPIFLVDQNCVPFGVLDEIERLKPSTIYLLGGPTTLGAGVQNLVPCP